MMATYFDPFRELDRATATRLASRTAAARATGRRMATDAYRDGDGYVLTADLPGVDADSIEIDVDGTVLTVRAKRDDTAPEGTDWITRERWTGTFERRFTLGRSVDTAAITAAYADGVLRVTLPVAEQAKPRRISVETGSSAPQPEVAA